MVTHASATQQTVYQAFAESCARYPQHPFLHIPHSACASYADSAIDVTYQQAERAVAQWAHTFAAGGYGAGHRVAIALQNRPQFFYIWFALNKLGVSVVPLNLEMQPDEMRYLLSHSESDLLVALPEFVDQLIEVVAELEKPLPVVSSDPSSALPTPASPALAVTLDGDSECALLYTSGSTGKPKGCILSNEYFVGFGRWYRDIGGLCTLEPGRERLLTPLPLVHMNAMAVSTMGMVLTGGCIIQLDRFHPKTWWQSVRDSGATVIHYLGVLPAILLNLPEGDDDFSQQVKFGFGAGVNPRHHATFEARFGFPLIEAWAMSECGYGGTIIANHEPRMVGTCCFGKPSAAVEVKLVDESGSEVATGEAGELLVRAAGDNPQQGYFSGYLKNPEETAKAWDGGWLNTGDVVRADEDGLLYFVDRRKNVIRRSGENISALEVEAVLTEHPDIHQVAVTPVPDDIRGEEVMALVVLQPGVSPNEQTANALVQHSLGALVYFKVPGYVAFCTELPLTASQKPRRADIKALAKQLHENGQCIDTCALKKRQK